MKTIHPVTRRAQLDRLLLLLATALFLGALLAALVSLSAPAPAAPRPAPSPTITTPNLA